MARRKTRNYFEPQRHPDHPRPVTRRQLIQQGFLTGGATIATGSIMSLFASPRAMAASHSRLSQDLQDIINAGTCPLIKTNVTTRCRLSASTLPVARAWRARMCSVAAGAASSTC